MRDICTVVIEFFRNYVPLLLSCVKETKTNFIFNVKRKCLHAKKNRVRSVLICLLVTVRFIPFIPNEENIIFV